VTSTQKCSIKNHEWLMVVILLFGLPCIAQASEMVHFAGFAYSGPYSDISAAFPYTYSLNHPGADGADPLDHALLVKVENHKFNGFNLDFVSLGNVQTNDALALAFALNRESVSVEQIGGLYKILIILDADALFFDMKQMQIVAAYPFGINYIDVSPIPPSKTYIQDLVNKLYLGDLKVNIIDQFSQTLESINLKQHYGNTIQITDVNISDKASAVLPDYLKNNIEATKDLIARQFSSYLSKNGNIPVLPYTKDYAIGNKIATRFANGDVFNLKVPTPDYTISLDILGFKKVIYDQEVGGASWVYGAFMHVKVMEPLSNHIYLDATIKNGAVKIVPSSQTYVDDWAAYQDTLLDMMNQLTKQLINPDESWIKGHTRTSDNLPGFQNVEKVIQSCQ